MEKQEALSLRWLANQFQHVEHPKDDADRISNCINYYCTRAADLISQQAEEIERLQRFVQFASTLLEGLQRDLDNSTDNNRKAEGTE